MTKREVAQQESENDVKKSPRHLLTDIHDESLDLNRSGDESISRVLARFAALLVVLSEKSDATTKENMEMQAKIVRLTWALCALTVILAILAFLELLA